MEDKNKDSTFPIRGKIINNINSLNKNTSSKRRCPKTGSFIGYKVALKYPVPKEIPISLRDLCILKLEIPEDAKRISTVGKKCRCDKAKVLRIYDFVSYMVLDDLRKCHSVITNSYSWHDPSFKYKLGETVSVNDFDDDTSKVCSSGIHFFRNIKDAVNYIIN